MTDHMPTAPCPPASITTVVDCATSITSILWESNALGVTYAVNATDGDGHYSSCDTSDSNCALTDMSCGTVYNVTVSGSLEGCMGAQTPEYTFRTGQECSF